ncbi:hypothetical protein XA68_17534 [Ophiocordyceps unilateralis]|uniref:Uncharacterized protein n=1 Tax=Ophiocordyceps unilateralis TaxID=268505 RepID=A0A2A9P4M5_OPHUN|nr:hypothetical protein XA68_17534 [Ophiocordyceps unilateralis]
MEKQSAAQTQSKWQWESIPGARDAGFVKSTVIALLWPCGSYARTSSRLRCALAGHHADSAPEPGFCNPDCAQFAGCLPFYGCLLARMQTTVRSFYGIDGNDYSDWADGCCCPCLTLVRNEREIIVREKQHSRLKQMHEPSNEQQYQSQSPMTVDPAKRLSSSSSSPPSDRNKGKDSLAPTADISTTGTSTTGTSSTDKGAAGKDVPLVRCLDQN